MRVFLHVYNIFLVFVFEHKRIIGAFQHIFRLRVGERGKENFTGIDTFIDKQGLHSMETRIMLNLRVRLKIKTSMLGHTARV